MSRGRLRFCRLLLLAFLLPALPASAGLRGQAGPYQVELTTEPAVIPVGKARLILDISSGGKPLDEAEVRAIAEMPGMPMGEREAAAQPKRGTPGRYEMPVVFSMAGDYVVTVKVTGPQGASVARIPVKTGQNSAASSGGGVSGGQIGLIAALLGLAAFVIYRMRRTGQHLRWRGLFTRQVLGGLALVLFMLAGAFLLVRNFRRPGAMTPIEAQGMEMSTPAPPGSAPVELGEVRRGVVESSVRYTGQATGFLEQNVTPRVRGYILWMPFYAGDRVKRGQLLARLDTSEVDPVLAERQAAVTMAQQGVPAARAEHRRSLSAVRQAEAEVSGARGALAEARSAERRARGAVEEAAAQRSAARDSLAEAEAELASAEEEGLAAGADAAGAGAELADAEGQLQAAQADQQYWVVQLARTRTLLTAGAVSDEEFRREKAQAENAEARVRQAQSRIAQVKAKTTAAAARARKAEAAARGARARAGRARSDIAAAEARLRQAQEEISGAASRVSQASSAIRMRQAQVRQEEEAAAAAQLRIRQAEAAVSEARAALGSAAAAKSYTAIRSQLDGVVVERSISPGTLVNPGQTILRVAQIDPIRLQANVAEADLAKIRPGAPVEVREQAGGPVIRSRVSSIAPAVDPTSRTGIVEAMAPNPAGRILPGEYVVMKLFTGRSTSALHVPAAAVRWQTAPGQGVLSTRALPYVWVAEPQQGVQGLYTVRRVQVQIGVTNGEMTEVLTGLSAGQKVVISGYDYLRDGDTASAPAGGAPPAARPASAPDPHAGHRPAAAGR